MGIINMFGNKNKGGLGNAAQGLAETNKKADKIDTGQALTQLSNEQKSGVDPEKTVEEQERPTVPKKVTCPRCKGDGVFHSNRTGSRAATSADPLIDPSKVCPKCKGVKEVTIFITHSQRNMEIRVEKAQKQAKQAADNARAAADAAIKIAKEAEAKLKG